jgi:pyroglutamyl-peptidase
MAVTILVTGFGRFPGAPFNPTGPLVQRLARLRRLRLADAKIIPHVFLTSYAALDRDLPMLLAKHRPHAILMFGLAPRARVLRIETRAQCGYAIARCERRVSAPPSDFARWAGRHAGAGTPPARSG